MKDQDEDEELGARIARDRNNAVRVSELAKEKLTQTGKAWNPWTSDPDDIEFRAKIHTLRRDDMISERAIADSSFHAMAELQTTTLTSLEDKSVKLWYVNKYSKVTQTLGGVSVLPWTHPGIQVALTSAIREENDFKFDGLTLRSVKPFARAKFDEVRPEISGIYEPGGRVYKSESESTRRIEHVDRINQQSETEPKAGLKAVRLGMSREQVHAFIARMSGMMVIIGAPGSGKTTVAFQRIRFLLDQQELRTEPNAIPFKPELTKVFLANRNLEFHANVLLETELQTPFSMEIITGVDDFVADYLKETWEVRNHATRVLYSSKNSLNLARQAVVGQMEALDLKRLWSIHECEIRTKLSSVSESSWCRRHIGSVEPLVIALRNVGDDTIDSDDPNNSRLNIERLYLKVKDQYNRVREKIRLKSRSELEPFEEKFKKDYERARVQVRLTLEQKLRSYKKKFKKSYERAFDQIKSSRKKEVKTFDKQFVNLYETATEQILCDSQKFLESTRKTFDETYSLASQQIRNSSQTAKIEVFDKPFIDLYKAIKEYLIDDLESYGGEYRNRNIRARKKEWSISPEKVISFSDSFIKLYERTTDEILRSSLIELRLVVEKFKQTYQNAQGHVHEPSDKAIVLFDRPFTELYDYVRKEITRELEAFDNEFRKWLYYVYDPLSSMHAYFDSQKQEIYARLKRSIGEIADVEQAIETAIGEWKNNKYRLEDSPWIAWLLRFSLPRGTDTDRMFKNIPSAISPALSGGEQWSHVVVDEAQDLSVAEASFLGSLVAPKGALTISLDFKQIVSPVKGMTDTEAFKVGRSIRDDYEDKRYPFGKNFRQSKEIGAFLKKFYRIAFKKEPNFDVNPDLRDEKPTLIIAERHEIANRIARLVREFRSYDSVESVAMIQVEEDEERMSELRATLKSKEVPLAEANQDYSKKGLVTSTVEKIKGLEFDACFLLGLENLNRRSAGIWFNRAYVGLSRPTRRLVMICETFPPVLNDMEQSLYDTKR